MPNVLAVNCVDLASQHVHPAVGTCICSKSSDGGGVYKHYAYTYIISTKYYMHNDLYL